jgi:hypothetical protein
MEGGGWEAKAGSRGTGIKGRIIGARGSRGPGFGPAGDLPHVNRDRGVSE